jgi:hypothetical protein
MTESKTELPVPIGKIYQDWHMGEMQSQEALEMLGRYLNMLDETLEPFENSKAQTRAWISEIVDFLGHPVEAAGFKMEITAPGVTTSYDKAALNKLADRLRAHDQGEIASEIEACLKETARAGSLRITRLKETSKH